MTDPLLRPCVPVHSQFYSQAAPGKMSTHILVIVNPLIKFLEEEVVEGAGGGHGSAQVGLHCRWDVKSWHTIGHESLEARAAYQRGQQETTGPGFSLAVTIFWEPG